MEITYMTRVIGSDCIMESYQIYLLVNIFSAEV